MTYLGHQVPIQSQQIYFLQTLIFFCFLYHFLSFSKELLIQRKLHAMQNFHLKTFVLVANAL